MNISSSTISPFKILVTGATGLVGSHLIKQLVKQNKSVKALYRAAIPDAEWASKVEWVNADILDVTALEEAFKDIHQVYHSAAMVSFNPSQRETLFKTNVEGTSNVVNAAIGAGVQKLLFVSSVAALGRVKAKSTVTETTRWNEETNKSAYGKSKYLSEMEVWRGIGEGLQAVIVNPVIILGSGQWDRGSSGIFKKAFEEFPWYSNGINGFVDVQDVVAAMIMLMEANVTAERFIVSAENLSYKQLFTAIANTLGKRPPHKLATPFIAELVWRFEALKAKITGTDPLLTKETARTAQATYKFDNSKLLSYFPNFSYTPIQATIIRVCDELKQMHKF
jgi:nucleoside-diphosphate-sugar epimerase